MTAMDKLSLNNQIVSMRIDARRAKLYTINKTVKKVKQLNERHGTEEQKSKFKQKSDRLLEELNIIKKLKDDEVSKFLLTIQEDPLKILNNPKSDAKTKALAKICMNKFLSSSLFEFKKKYPNWKTEIPLLLPQLGRKSKKKYKSEHIKEQPSVKNNSPTPKKKLNDSQVVNTPGNNGFLVENITKRTNLEDSEANNSSRKNETMRNPKDTYENNNDNKSLVNEKFDKKISASMRNCKKKVEKQETSGGLLQREEKREVDKKVVDPFFVTADNSQYMTVVTSEKQIAALTNASENTTFKTENSFSFQKYNGNINSNNFKKFSDEKFHANKSFSKSDFKGKLELQKPAPNRVRKLSINNLKNENNNEQLHPSWEAKRRQTSLAQFSGKKIVFNDD